MVRRAVDLKTVGRTADSGEVRMELDGWITQFGPSVLHFAYGRLRDRGEAEDVFQEVFLRAYLNRPSLENPAGIKPWLLALTANACRDRARWWQRQRSQTVAGEVPDLVDPAADTAQTVMNHAGTDALWRKILSLPPLHREVIVLYYFEDLRIREIANVLKCNEQAVKTRLHRARRRLKDILPEEGGYRDR